jgi:hypothetical protein
VAVLHCPRQRHARPPPSACALGELLGRQRMEESVARLEQAEKLQRSLYAIADMAGSDLDMPDMLRGLHRIVSDLMYAENFYIAMYDRERDSLRFLYFADVVTNPNLLAGRRVPLSRIEQGLTWYLTRDKRPLMGSTEELRTQVSGRCACMARQQRLAGRADAARRRSAGRGRRAELHRRSLLHHGGDVAAGLRGRTHPHRARAQARPAELERHVVERTQQLQVANHELRREVAERERGERLQAALYRIAALASLDERASASIATCTRSWAS